MFFDDYKIHSDSKVNSSLLWEYDLSAFDYQQMRQVVVLRVIERGWTMANTSAAFTFLETVRINWPLLRCPVNR